MLANIKNPSQVPPCTECEGRKDHSLFCCLSYEELDNFSSEKGGNFYKKGQVIFYEGNRGHGLYCIYKGKVKIHKLGEDAKDQIVRLANSGEVLGYRSLLGDEPFNATATAIEDTIVCYIPKNKLFETLEKNSELSLKTIQLLTKDLKESEKRLLSITQKPVIERVAETLLILKEKFGLKRDGKTLEITLSRKEIGDLSGITTETTIRTLSDLNKKGIISLSGKNIAIVKMQELLTLANLSD